MTFLLDVRTLLIPRWNARPSLPPARGSLKGDGGTESSEKSSVPASNPRRSAEDGEPLLQLLSVNNGWSVHTKSPLWYGVDHFFVKALGGYLSQVLRLSSDGIVPKIKLRNPFRVELEKPPGSRSGLLILATDRETDKRVWRLRDS